MKHFNYKELLESDEWIERRNLIIKRDKVCQNCGSSYNLNVHHTFYVSNMHPAFYAESTLILLCNKCHSEEHYYQNLIENAIKYMRMNSIPSKTIWDKYLSQVNDKEFMKFHNEILDYKNKRL